MKDEYCPLVKDWMVQRVIPNHKAIMALENKPLVNTDEPSQVHDEKDSEDLVKNIINKAVENLLKVTIKYRHRISLYSSNILFHKWKVLADFNFYLVHDKALIIMVIKLTVSCRVPVTEQLSSHN